MCLRNEKSYKANDIITFYDENKTLVTHRLIDVDEELIVTKGDNNDSQDGKLPVKNIIGKYVFKISCLGIVMSSLKSPITLIMIFIIGVLIVTFISTDDKLKPLDKEIEESKKKVTKKVNKTTKPKSVDKKQDTKNTNKPKTKK